MRLLLWTEGWALKSSLSFAVRYVRQAVQVCLLVETYEFWQRPWGKQGHPLQRCCKMCPALLKAQRCNSLMVLLKTFIEPFCICDHLWQCRSLSWACTLLTWWKYSLCSFFPHGPFILRRTQSWVSFILSDMIVFAICSCWKGSPCPLLMDSKMHPF